MKGVTGLARGAGLGVRGAGTIGRLQGKERKDRNRDKSFSVRRVGVSKKVEEKIGKGEGVVGKLYRKTTAAKITGNRMERSQAKKLGGKSLRVFTKITFRSGEEESIGEVGFIEYSGRRDRQSEENF